MSFVRSLVLAAVAASAAAACAGSSPEVAEMPAPADTQPAAPPAVAAAADTGDPRVGLAAGWRDAGVAARNLELVGHVDRPEGFYDPQALGNLLLGNTDLAFQGDRMFVGSFHGFNIYDIANPESPRLLTSFPCPGGQGDVSVYEHLLFMSVEMPNGRVDCGTEAPTANSSPDRFRGVRIFDISDISAPKQIAAVQTCRGSHTHTLVTDPDDAQNVYIYVSGTAPVRPATELAGCSGGEPGADPNTAMFRIEVIQVPLAAPATARIVSTPRLFADAETGDIAGLWQGGTHGPGTQETSMTNQCHDITVYPEIGLAAGACSGNGILIDISDPDAPTRVDEVIDPNFAYWHSATFSNDGSRILFTDEWGGGTQARCLATDDPEWGADAIFRVDDREMTLAGYYKLPAPQTAAENCVAHNGSLIPVPGRDIMAQAWYQGGTSVFDFTDPANPVEIAFFDRGPLGAELMIGGHWGSYWYNGYLYASEIARGVDVFALQPSEHLTQNEIDAAKLVRVERSNPQHQTRITWPAEFVVARALLDQLRRGSDLPADRVTALASGIETAESMQGAARQASLRQLAATAHELHGSAADGSPDARRLELLATTLEGLAR